VRFIDGFPGKYVVLARRSQDRGYVAGVNGETTPREITIDLGALKARSASVIQMARAAICRSDNWK